MTDERSEKNTDNEVLDNDTINQLKAKTISLIYDHGRLHGAYDWPGLVTDVEAEVSGKQKSVKFKSFMLVYDSYVSLDVGQIIDGVEVTLELSDTRKLPYFRPPSPRYNVSTSPTQQDIDFYLKVVEAVEAKFKS